MKVFLCVCLLSTFNSVAGYVEIGNLPANVTIHEDLTSAKFLYSVLAYWPAPSGSDSCSIAAGDTGSNFELKVENGAQNIYTVSSPTFDYDSAMSYVLSIECTDGTDTVTESVTVLVTENVGPVFSNLPGYVEVSAKTTKANHVIFTVSYTDPDDTPPLTYSNLVMNPAGGPFTIANDQVTVTSDLLTHRVTSYLLTFDVTDGRNLTSQTINVTINDVNTKPIFVGDTTTSINISENTAGRLLVFDIDHVDGDGDSVQFEYAVVDANNAIWDLVGATGEIFLISGNTLDFETLNTYTFVVKLSDYLDEAEANFTLTIYVNDVSETPTFTGVPNAVNVSENSTGTVIGTLSELCTDPDGLPPDNITYAILFSTYSSYFSINNYSAEVSFALDWDFDTTLPENVNLTIRCSDIDGNSDDAIYQITILDVNDNNPVCAPSVTAFNLTYAQAVNVTLVNLGCSDLDSTVNAELDYTEIGLTSGYGQTYFDVDASGNVSINTAFTIDINTTFYVTFLVTDRGTPSLSATVTLTITYTERPPVYNYKEVEPCFLCTTGSFTIIAAFCFTVFIIFIFCSVLFVLWCCYNCERWTIHEVLGKRKKRKWRICGCLRPGGRRKRKRSRKEIEQAQREDREYMRARDALLGVEGASDPVPTQAVYKPPKSASTQAGKKPLSRSKPTSSMTSSLGTSVSLKGRQAPSSKLDPRVVTPSRLTESQKLQLEKFREMQNKEEAGPSKPGPSRRMKAQAASGMVWSFHGREDPPSNK